MGWNDFGSLVNLQFKKNKIIYFLTIILCLYPSYMVNSDEPLKDNKQTKDEVVTYRFKLRYQKGIIQHWKYSEVTNVKRTFSDSSTLSFQRNIIYYFTIKCLDLPSEGFEKINITIDSIDYSFNDGAKVYKFNSQSEEDGDVNFEDVKANTITLSREFDLTYSPYGEIAKIEGEQLDYYKNYIMENANKGVDSTVVLLWLKGLSQEALVHYVDPKKILLPPGPITLDSIWKTPFQITVNGINYYDTLTTKITSKKKISYIFLSESNNLRSYPQKAVLFSIKQPVNVDSSLGKGTYTIQLHSRGIIEKAEADFNITSYISFRREHFTEGIKTKINWELLNQYK